MIEGQGREEHGGAAFHEATAPDTSTQAREMLLAFASVGAHHFNVTLKNERTDAIEFDRGRTVNGLSLSLPSLLCRAEQNGQDFIIRPISNTPLIQLDDLTAESVQRVKDFAFIVIETSRGNFQAWLCVTDANDTTARRLRENVNADLRASGAVRLAGTVNRKIEHAPNFPTVRLIETQPERTTTTSELQAQGLLTKIAPITGVPPRVPSLRRFQSRTWPSYERCLNDAPDRHSGKGKDLSRADWKFAWIAADRGFSAGEIAAELMNLSEKAKTDGIKYAERTARNAFESVARRKAPQ